jgi:hypothetical protein
MGQILLRGELRMLRMSAFVLLFGSLLVAAACHGPESHEHGPPEHAAAPQKSSDEKSADANPKACKHHIEEPFCLKGGGAGAGIVYGTADFASGGGVTIKVQVEDTNPTLHTATVTVWSGTDSAGVTTPSVPSTAQQVLTTGSALSLRYYTTHLDRLCPLGTQRYWLLVCVEYPTQPPEYFFNSWVPTPGSSTQDEPHDFDGLGHP